MDEALKVAVDWWAAQLGGTTQDNGDAMTAVLMPLLQDRMPKPTEAQIETFKTVLTEALRKRLDGPPYLRGVHNDYHPDPVLREAARAAGIEADCPPFPIKTNMWITDESVKVCHGYHGETKVLWEKEAATSTRGVDK